MKHIPKINYLSQSRNAEHYNLYLQTLNNVSEDFANKYKISPFRDKLVAAFKEEDEAYLQTQAFANTDEIYEKDAASDDRFRYVWLSVQSKLLSPVKAEAEAAKKVTFEIKVYAGAFSKPFAENIAMVTDMVKKLQSDELVPSVQALGLTDAVEALKKANEEFIDIYSRRADEKRVRSVTDNLKKIRPEVDKSAREMFEAINALFLVNELVEKDTAKASELGAVIDAVNAHIVEFSTTLSRRGVGKKAKIEPDDKPIITDPDPTPPEDDRPVIE